MISSRQTLSKPFITDITTTISHTPAAMPTTQIPVTIEMKVWRRLAVRYRTAMNHSTLLRASIRPAAASGTRPKRISPETLANSSAPLRATVCC